jgi:hypothetical protein
MTFVQTQGLDHHCTVQKRSAGSKNTSNESLEVWANDQVNIPCFFYTDTGPTLVLDPGQFEEMSTKLLLPAGTVINSTDYRILSAQQGFVGYFRIKGSVHSVYGYRPNVVDHLEAEIEQIPAGAS